MVSFARYLLLHMPAKLWRFGPGSTRGSSKAKILSTSHHGNALVQVAALKQLLLAGPCIPPHMLVQNDHPLSDYNSQTFHLFNIETTVQDTTCTWWCTNSGTSSTCICTYTCTSTWQCACAVHIVHLTFVHALGKLALLLALALDYAVAMCTGTWHLHLHLYLHLASLQCTSTCTSTWQCARTGTWPKWLVWPHGSLMARALGPVLFPYLQPFSFKLPIHLIYCLKNNSLAIVL